MMKWLWEIRVKLMASFQNLLNWIWRWVVLLLVRNLLLFFNFLALLVYDEMTVTYQSEANGLSSEFSDPIQICEWCCSHICSIWRSVLLFLVRKFSLFLNFLAFLVFDEMTVRNQSKKIMASLQNLVTQFKFVCKAFLILIFLIYKTLNSKTNYLNQLVSLRRLNLKVSTIVVGT